MPGGYDFNSEFDTYILAYCPDTCSWFATNRRFFYYEYPREFESEAEAIEYFKARPHEFLFIETGLGVYRPAFLEERVFLDNIGVWLDAFPF